ncbi:14633_t:CDS:1, partial [Entrophospora sp. SA101]
TQRPSVQCTPTNMVKMLEHSETLILIDFGCKKDYLDIMG